MTQRSTEAFKAIQLLAALVIFVLVLVLETESNAITIIMVGAAAYLATGLRPAELLEKKVKDDE